MSTVKDFLKELRESPKAMELLGAAKEPANAEEAAQLYADIAEKAGISVSKETICEFLKGKERIQKAVAAKAEETLKSALSENELDNVAGGVELEGKQETVCKDTFMPGEWCWMSDYCSVVITSYDLGQSEYFDRVEHDVDSEWTVVYHDMDEFNNRPNPSCDGLF